MAAGQFGVVSRAQLDALGLTPRMIDRRGWLRRVLPSVYAVGHIGFAGRASAALLWAGPDALLSHETAAVLWELLPENEGPIHVTCARGRRTPQGLVVHGVRALPRVTKRRGLAVTTAERTLLDVPDRRLLNEALYLRRTSVPQLRKELQASPSHPNVRALRRLVETGTATHSHLEDRFLKLVAKASLPRPETNMRIAGYEVDCLWRTHKVIVELDGWAAHGTRHAFERDARKAAALQRAGFVVLRFTYEQVTAASHEVVATLAAALYSAASSHQ